ncbi:subtilisin protease SBT5.4 [Trifolium repens]|nr:subtilisin protease SBT5.4 [Trifolium repens]
MINKDVATDIAQQPDVISVFITGKCTPQTTNSWVFLGFGKKDKVPKDSLWQKNIWGRHNYCKHRHIFSDEEMGPILARWRGICQTDKDNSDDFHCNRKLIGASFFSKNYEKHGGNAIRSACDFNGHGTHTLSIVGGNFVHTSVLGIAMRMTSGGLPKARVAAYKVFEYEQDILTAFDHATTDGVDVVDVVYYVDYVLFVALG